MAPFKKPSNDLRVRTIIQAISDLRDAVDGDSDDDQVRAVSRKGARGHGWGAHGLGAGA